MRKTLWTIALAVLGATAARAADPAPPASNKLFLEIGDVPGNHPGAEWFLHQVELYKAAHPETTLSVFGIGGDSRAVRPLQSLPDLPENVLGIESITGGETAYLAERGLIVPIERFLPDPEFSLEAFDKSLYDAVTYDGKLWGIPWYVEGMFMVYDVDQLKAAGLNEPPRTWKELLAVLERLGRDADGDGRPEEFAVRINGDNTLPMIWLSILLQQGVNVLDETGLHVDSEAARAAFDLVQRLANSPYTRVTQDNSAERCAISFQTVHRLQKFLKETEKYRMQIAPLPSEGLNISFRMRGIYLCVRKSTPEREAASWEFIKWIARLDAPPFERFDGFLCRADVMQRPDLKSLPLADEINLEPAFRSMSQTVDPAPHLAGRLLALMILREGFNAALQGKVSYEEGILEAATKANAMTSSRRKADASLELVQ